MKLRMKVGLTLGGTIAALAIVSYLFAHSYVVNGYENQEKEYAYQNVQRSLGALAAELREVKAVARENAVWDDAYVFMQKNDAAFMDRAFPQESFNMARLHFLAFVDLTGTSIALRFRDGYVVNAADRAKLERQFVHTARLIRAQNAPQILTGVVNFPGGPMLLTAAPVLPSTGRGSARGALICGRKLDDDELVLLSKSIGVVLSVFAVGSSMPSDVQNAALDLPSKSLSINHSGSEDRAESLSLADVPVLVRPLDEDTMGGYFRLFDLDENPSVVLRITQSREIHAQGRAALATITGVTILGGVALGLVMMGLLEMTVLGPVIGLSRVVAGVGKSAGFSARIQPHGKDELADLARAINKSLSSAESSSESQRVAQDALRSAKEYAEKLLQTANAIVLGLDQNQHVFAWNEIAEKITGYSQADIKKRDWLSLLIPADQALRVRREFERLRQAGAPTSFESPIIARNGERRNIAWHNNVLRDQERIVGTVSFGIDITARKQMEEDLSRSEIAYRSLVEGAPYGIFRLAPGGKLLLANPALANMLGYRSSTELLSAPVAPELFSNTELCKQLLKDGLHGAISSDAVWKRKDGKEIAVRLTGRAVQQDHSVTSYCEVFSEDVTDKQRLQEQFYQAQKMEAVGRLAGGVAHDFNNLLGVIIGYSDLILDGANLDDRLKSKIEQIKKSGQRAAALTGQLLAYSRKQILQLRVLSLNSSITDAQKMLHRLIGEDIELVTILEPSLSAIKADPTQIDQILLNLAVNARDAMPQGGKLTVRTENLSVYEPVTFRDFEIAANEYVVLTVSDTGVGMDAETQARIFEPFFTTKGHGKGTGLGLATVYGIVKQSHGYVLCESQAEKGTSFRIFFPRVQEAVREAANQNMRSPLPRGSETVLVAEDAESLRSLIRDFLAQLGYRVLEAGNGSQALYVAQNHDGPIHLLLTDIVMPGMGGQELAKNFTSLRPSTKLLYMSGYTDDTIVRHGIEEGAVALLTKPFTMDTMAQKVREVLA